MVKTRLNFYKNFKKNYGLYNNDNFFFLKKMNNYNQIKIDCLNSLNFDFFFSKNNKNIFNLKNKKYFSKNLKCLKILSKNINTNIIYF